MWSVFNKTPTKGHLKGDSDWNRVGMKRANTDEPDVCFSFRFRNSRENPALKWSEKKLLPNNKQRAHCLNPAADTQKQRSIHRTQNMFIPTIEPLICSCKLCVWLIGLHFITELCYSSFVLRPNWWQPRANTHFQTVWPYISLWVPTQGPRFMRDHHVSCTIALKSKTWNNQFYCQICKCTFYICGCFSAVFWITSMRQAEVQLQSGFIALSIFHSLPLLWSSCIS